MKHVLTSYSQFGEDIKLFSALRDVLNVFYIDVGANDPQSNSVTKLFYDRGVWDQYRTPEFLYR